jgi:hypothetical protein
VKEEEVVKKMRASSSFGYNPNRENGEEQHLAIFSPFVVLLTVFSAKQDWKISPSTFKPTILKEEKMCFS